MPQLFHCIYTSVEARPLSGAEIARLVKESRESNALRGLTGILLHVGNTFFQVLEGDPEVLTTLYGKILKDPRHTRVTRIIFEPIPHRYFADCDMQLATLSPGRLADLLDQPDAGVTEDLLSSLDEGRAKRLLRAFSDGRWRNSTPVAEPLGAVSA